MVRGMSALGGRARQFSPLATRCLFRPTHGAGHATPFGSFIRSREASGRALASPAEIAGSPGATQRSDFRAVIFSALYSGMTAARAVRRRRLVTIPAANPELAAPSTCRASSEMLAITWNHDSATQRSAVAPPNALSCGSSAAIGEYFPAATTYEIAWSAREVCPGNAIPMAYVYKPPYLRLLNA